MDHRRFDAVTRSLAGPRSRRGFLGGLAALGAGVLAGRSADAQPVTQASCGNQTCKNNPGKCRAGCVCCLYRNAKGQITNSRCQPPGTCGPGEQVGGSTTPPGVCPPKADVCTNQQGAQCGPGLGCSCYRSINGGTVCASGGSCSACGSDADCENEFGVIGLRCVVAGGCCAGSSETICVAPCPGPV